MKLELTGIFKEVFPPPQAANAPDVKPVYQVVARFSSVEDEPYCHLNVPIEMVGDAKVGDEFMVYLERVRK